ncbi:Fc receptor-like protein 5 [Sardina pilchardus]|uniref:Fc receptor-like protein 5 n=1 Tax=Sardina pilchardus TaxID=27697 RepID=UPI002E149F27
MSMRAEALPTATVTVKSPEGPYYPGDEVTLRCDIAEYVDWYQYYWYRDQDSIKNGESRSITISLPDQAGQYQYTCEGTREDNPKTSQRSTPASMTVTDFPVPSLTVQPSPVFTGEAVTLTCVIQPSTGWTYAWDKPLSSTASETITHIYTISRASVFDQGEYKCSGVRDGSRKSSPYSNTVQLIVRPLPTATVESPEGPYYPGDKVILKCDIAEYTGWYRYYWYKDGYSIQNGASRAITIPLPDQAGQYTCEGSRINRPKTSQRSTPAIISITALPTATVTIEPESPVYVGEEVTLKCVIYSEGDWAYKWFKGSSSNHLSQPDTSTLTITAAAKSDESHYWCQGKIRGRAVSSQMSGRVDLAVKDLPTAAVAVESPQPPFYSGEKVTLRCDIEQYTERDQYVWYKGSQQISRQKKKTITVSRPEDAGQYTCKGRRGVRPINSQHSASVSISVTALPTPTLSVQPESPVFTGEEVTLKCEIEPEGVWKYKWYKDKSNIPHSQTYTNTYPITAAAESHEGQYWCQGERTDRPTTSQPSRKIKLDVKALPTATVTVESPEGPYYPGDEVTLKCVVANYRKWYQYNWYRTGRPADPFYYKSQTITITLPDKVGQSHYTCDAFRGNRPQHSKRSDPLSISTQALPLATLTVEPQSPVFTGETVTLECVIESLTGWTYKWYKESSRSPVSEGNIFTIRGAAESHKGQYWCQGERRHRPTASQPSRRITIDVKASKPKLILGLSGHQLFTGDSMTLRCELGVSSGLVFYWYRDTQTSDPVAQTNGDSYSISSVKVSDGGQYWCRAGRGGPVYNTQYSDAAKIKVTDLTDA